MNQYLSLSAEFERQKNVKASLITFGVAGILVLLFIFWKWPLPSLPQPTFEELIEVNLGSSDQGFGSDQPMLPGEPAPAQQTAYNPPTPVQSHASEVKSVETDDRDETAPAIKNPVVTKPNATRINDNSKTIRTTTTPQPVITETPPRPKAVLGRTVGSNGNGGNGAETYQRGGNEGIAGGNGDQGRPGGSPNGRNYNGTPRNIGVRVVSIPSQSFEDDFNENAKVALDVVVNESGRLISASLQPRGTTTSNRKIIDIARRRAYEINYPKYDGGFKQTLIFDFKLRS
ncbi:MAG: hypothetical protein ICV66_11865 [Chitinophagaceae bacterium]|nr:hypothetical protein [Chitinophagaceae bacterium]